MSQLEHLQNQIDIINKRIYDIKHEIDIKELLIKSIETKKIEIDKQLLDEQSQYEKMVKNHKELNELKNETSVNFNQIEEAAVTLLDIIKSKCDSIS